MMCTRSENPPDITSMRCVPSSWCTLSSHKPVKVWDDTGAGGGKAGSIWTINSMDMIAVTIGHDAPQDTFYELNSQRFFLEGFKSIAVEKAATTAK
jgi:hypothetical protein